MPWSGINSVIINQIIHYINLIYNDVLSLSNNATFFERYNAKSQIVCGGNKCRNETNAKVLSDVINVCENGLCLALYDIRRPALQFAYKSTRQRFNVDIAMNQSWYREYRR